MPINKNLLVKSIESLILVETQKVTKVHGLAMEPTVKKSVLPQDIVLVSFSLFLTFFSLFGNLTKARRVTL